MSLTGSGFDSSLRGGSFLGKKNSSKPRESDFHSGSKVSGASNKFSSGSLPGFGTVFGFTSVDAIVPRFGYPWWCSNNAIFGKCGPYYTDEPPLQQVAS